MSNQPRFQRVVRSTVYEQVSEKLRSAILDRSWGESDRLPPERELAAQFGVSRTTVREALRHLQAQGLVTARGRTSPMQPANPDAAVARFREALTHVVQLRDVSLGDLVELRIAVESCALVRAAGAPLEQYVKQAHAALEEMSDRSTSRAAFYDADVAFHLALVAASGNQALLLVMLAVKDAIRMHLDVAARERSFTKLRSRVIAEHRALLAAVERGHAEKVTKLLAAHLSEFYAS